MRVGILPILASRARSRRPQARYLGTREIVHQPAKPLDNADLTIRYRKKMARVYVERALRDLAGLPYEGAPAGGMRLDC